tara:strand:- start:340 stop:525 length:186 start_codon:yes stop_codon:yes gene_type:complete
MPSVVFAFGDSSKEVDLKDVNSVEDVASNMKEVIKKDSFDEPIKRPGIKNLDNFEIDFPKV